MEERTVRIPDKEAFEEELKRLNTNSRFQNILRNTVFTLIVVAAAAVLVATLWMPFLRIYGTSMTPTLENGNIVACVKKSTFDSGDVIAFYYNNKILVKRVIGQAGDRIDIKEDGTVFVNGEELEEPYISEKALGECDLTFPYQVPESAIFVIGDHRDTSIDSRSTTVGAVSEEQIVGKVLFRIWPLSRIGTIH